MRRELRERRLRRRCTSTSRSCRSSRLGRALLSAASCRWWAPSTPTPRTRSPTASPPVVLGGRRRMNRLHVRIAVSEAAAWTARRFYGGRYRIIPNGVHLLGRCSPSRRARRRRRRRARCGSCSSARPSSARACRCCCARSRRCASSPRDAHARRREPRGGRAHDARRPRRARARQGLRGAQAAPSSPRADVLCAPSLHGESFGMVLTEAFAAATPVRRLGHPRLPRRRARRHRRAARRAGGDPLALAEALRRLALDAPTRARDGARRARARRALRLAARRRRGARLLRAGARAIGAPGDARRSRSPCATGSRPPTCSRASPPSGCRALLARRRRRVRRRRAASAHAASRRARRQLARRAARSPRWRCSASASPASPPRCSRSKPGPARGRPGADVRRDVRARDRLARDPRRRRPPGGAAKRRDAMQGTFIGVLMSATLPARLGEPSRALIVARRLGRARETLPDRARHDRLADAAEPARARDPRRRHALERHVLDGHDAALLALSRWPRSPRCSSLLLAPVLVAAAPRSRARERLRALLRRGCVARCCACATACACSPARAHARARHGRCSSARGRCSGCPAGCC